MIFDSWCELWEAVERLRKDPADPIIGNWEPVIEDLVSLRDGRAAERIGQYLARLQKDLTSGRSPAEAMERAAAWYEQVWEPRGMQLAAAPFQHGGE